MPYIDKEKFRMHIIMYQYNPLKVKLTDKEKEKFTRMLDEVPTADVVEVKHGEWKVAMLDHESMGCRPKVHYCSVCNHITTFRTFFCPNCGADMRGGTDG